MKWGEIQIITLQKMFAKDEPMTIDKLESYKEDDDCKVYIAGMPAVANEAIQRVARHCQNRYEYNSKTKKYEKVEIVKITSETSAEDEIDLPESACVLIPLYMASQLYKDDDVAQATAYRNEFEVGLADLDVEIDNPHQIENVWEV